MVGDRRLMFWLQDKRTNNDSDHCEKVNQILSGRDQNNQANEPGGDLLRLLRWVIHLYLLFIVFILPTSLLFLVYLFYRGNPRGAGFPAAAAPAPARDQFPGGIDLGRIIQGIQAAGINQPPPVAAPAR